MACAKARTGTAATAAEPAVPPRWRRIALNVLAARYGQRPRSCGHQVSPGRRMDQRARCREAHHDAAGPAWAVAPDRWGLSSDLSDAAWRYFLAAPFLPPPLCPAVCQPPIDTASALVV